MLGKIVLTLIFGVFVISQCFQMISLSQQMSLDEIANSIASSLSNVKYDLHTSQGNHMDCLKIIRPQNDPSLPNMPDLIGVFHSGNPKTQYSNLYYAEYFKSTDKWETIITLSQRGSQGTIVSLQANGIKRNAYFIAYELENHQNGNTYAIRYYSSIADIRNNFFMYQYQLSKLIDSRVVRNIGTPSIQQIAIVKQSHIAKDLPELDSYFLQFRFHYSPDGSHDYPGIGNIILAPLRDFVVDGKWIGGCLQNFNKWIGTANTIITNAINKAGAYGKIGQRDSFLLGNPAKRYYLYQANLNTQFDWRNWRIYIVSEDEGKAKMIPLKVGGAIDFANPHVSLIDTSTTQNTYSLTLFVPSQAITPNIDAKAGQMSASFNL